MVKILIIEDRKDDLTTIRQILDAKGFETEVVMTGAEAQKFLNEKFHFDLILLDYFLPDVTGNKLIQIIRERLGSSVKVIFVTILGRDEVEGTQIDGHITKPFFPEQLLSEINRCLKK